MIYLICKNCNSKVSAIIDHSGNDEAWENYESFCEKDFIVAGQYFKDPDDNFILNIKDKVNLDYHPDSKRLTGCCGPSESQEPNLICKCGTEIGREITDCINPHYIRILTNMVKEVDDKWMALGLIKDLEKQNPQDERLSCFYNLVQYGNENEILKYINQNLKKEK